MPMFPPPNIPHLTLDLEVVTHTKTQFTLTRAPISSAAVPTTPRAACFETGNTAPFKSPLYEMVH